MTPRTLDPRLHLWWTVHRPQCPLCRKLPLPPAECARVWAIDWAAEAYPVNELVDVAEEEAREKLTALQDETIRLRLEMQDLERNSVERNEALRELAEEVELLRRDNATLRASAEEDFEAANNWRRYVAVVGEKRASLYLVPPRKEDGH